MTHSIPESDRTNPARDVSLDAIIRATATDTPRPVAMDTSSLSALDARLADAIHRTTMQRWLTVNYVIDRCLDKPKIEPALRAVLAMGAAQLIFMDRLPAHAVVNVAVNQAKARVRPGAGGLVNAVLRRVGEMVAERLPDEPWEPRNNRIPWGEGQIRLSRQSMLKPRRLVRYLSVATSHAEALVAAWIERWGNVTATRLLTHSLKNAPTFVHADGQCEMWQGDHGSLAAMLADHTDRWVQDPTAARAVAAAAHLSPKRIVDFCAGKGTKTRQLAAAFPDAQITAADVDEQRFDTLRKTFSGLERVRVMPPSLLTQQVGKVDLLVLDVPCSNTGVMARRPEAKYRYNDRTQSSVIALQQQILQQAAPLLAPGGHVLYATCSIEPDENEQQAQWAAGKFGWELDSEHTTLPGGDGQTYHDGGYWALLSN